MEHLNEELRCSLVRLTNRRGETPLHLAVRARQGGLGSSLAVSKGASGRRNLAGTDIFSIKTTVREDGDCHGGGNAKEVTHTGKTSTAATGLQLTTTMSTRSRTVAVQVWSYFSKKKHVVFSWLEGVLCTGGDNGTDHTMVYWHDCP